MQGMWEREREHSVGAHSISSVATGASQSVQRSTSRRKGKGNSNQSTLGSSKRRADRHSLALESIRTFLKGRSCYDCLPVSFRLVVLDTKLVVKPALEVMWQAGEYRAIFVCSLLTLFEGIVSAPLWQSASEPGPTAASAGGADESKVSSGVPDTLRTSSESAMSPASQHPQNTRSTPQTEGSSSPLSDPSVAKSNNPISRSGGPTPGKAGFAGMLTVNDIIHLIQYYYHNSSYDNATQDVERFRLEMLRDIEQTLQVPQPPLLSIEPLRPIFDACKLLMETHARRLPLLDHDAQTGMDTVVSVLTQYRVLKFIAMNCRETAGLHRSIRSLGVGTYVSGIRNELQRSTTLSSAVSSSRRDSSVASTILSPTSAHGEGLPNVSETDSTSQSQFSASPPQSSAFSEPGHSRRGSLTHEPLATATLDTTVFDVVHIFSELGVSAVPILDEEGYVVDLYETVDVIDLVRSGAYQSLDLTIRQALSRRPKDFPGVMTCSPDDSLATIFALLRSRRVHRLVILEPEQSSSASPKEEENNQNSAADIAEAASGAAQQRQQPPHLAGKDIRRRKRGKLAGILCLSDVLRYIIGTTEPISNKSINRSSRKSSVAGGTSTAASTAASDYAEGLHPPSASAGLSGAASDHGEPVASSAQTFPDQEETPWHGPSQTPMTPANRFDPSDMPPTIEEVPTGETLSPSNLVTRHANDDVTPTDPASQTTK